MDDPARAMIKNIVTICIALAVATSLAFISATATKSIDLDSGRIYFEHSVFGVTINRILVFDPLLQNQGGLPERETSSLRRVATYSFRISRADGNIFSGLALDIKSISDSILMIEGRGEAVHERAEILYLLKKMDTAAISRIANNLMVRNFEQYQQCIKQHPQK